MTGRLDVDGRPPGGLRGRLRVPGDKSISHRALLLGARAEGTSVVRGLSGGEDVRHTRAAVSALGAVVEGERVTGGRERLREATAVLDVGNSGTGIRLLAGFVAPFPWLTVLAGDESVARRPMDRVVQPLRLMGAAVDGREAGGFPPLVVRGGGLHGINYTLPVASAQVKSAILLAGLGAEGETVIREPEPTRAHTEEMLAACGADIAVDEGVIRLRPGPLSAFDLDVPGDPSQAAFWVVAACLVPGSELTVERVYVGRARAGFLDVLRRMGAAVEVEPVGRPEEHVADIHARHGPLAGTEVGGPEIPGLIDEIPVLAVAAAGAEGRTVFRDAAELAVKESDRIAVMAAELSGLGARIEPRPDGLIVTGAPGGLRGGAGCSHGDHRVAMALAVAGLAASGPTRIDGWDAVATSYPGFSDDLQSLAERRR
jgi:3-phosphoshikimate 1-carboxyvinyltransferase